jgi:SMC interacting uncharacterized protein involved in chromosome segregation
MEASPISSAESMKWKEELEKMKTQLTRTNTVFSQETEVYRARIGQLKSDNRTLTKERTILQEDIIQKQNEIQSLKIQNDRISFKVRTGA